MVREIMKCVGGQTQNLGTRDEKPHHPEFKHGPAYCFQMLKRVQMNPLRGIFIHSIHI